MKRFLGLICNFFALVFATTASADELTIATFNAEFLITDRIHVRDGFPLRLNSEGQAEWPDSRRQAAFDAAVQRMVPVILEIDADVLVLTEIGGGADFDKISQAFEAASLGYIDSALCECTDSATQQHVAIFSRFPLSEKALTIEGREHYLAERDDEDSELDTGLSKGVRAEFTFAGETFAIYGIHLKSERGFSEADEQRIAQASIVRRTYLKDLQMGRHVIVAGDLNDKRGDPTLLRIRGLDDIWPDLIQTGASKYFKDDEVGERWTYQFDGNRNQIDHVLVSTSVLGPLSRSDISTRVIRVNDDQISDHSPLVVTLDF